MAQRRMFSLKIVDADAFLEMPQSSQLLYFHLSMRADDDGFVANPKRIMRMIGSQEDDFKILLAKRFVLPFESGVCVIKHWRMHNYIQNDRYSPTVYVEEKKRLKIKENGSYTDNVSSLDTQVRLELGKDRLGEELASPTATQQEEVFSLKNEIQKLYESPRRDLNLIGWYFEKRQPDIRTKGQLQSALRRHLRAAKELSPFTDDQLGKAWRYVASEYPEWTLETLLKKLVK